MPREITARYISGKELERYCNARNVNAKCLRCGSVDWDLHDTEVALGMVGQLNGLDGHPLDSQTHLVTLSCKNCATMWALVRGQVQEWLDENPSTDETHD